MKSAPGKSVILVFAKAPQAGYAKTRLIPALGEEGSARLHRSLIGRTMQMLSGGTPWPLQLWCAPDCSHPFFGHYAGDPRVSLHRQRGCDLGERMHHALSEALLSHERAILIGTDCPELQPRHLREAVSALGAGYDAVLGPALDGGYYLVGLNRELPALFHAIDWGSPRVMQQTRDRLAAGGMRWHELEVRRDLDRPGDLAIFSTLLNDNHEVTGC
ncbi:MAG: TIGR04282 family arsenosugar biosynthesis glycosyltransferase [Gammaproteobacteria bacterium]